MADEPRCPNCGTAIRADRRIDPAAGSRCRHSWHSGGEPARYDDELTAPCPFPPCMGELAIVREADSGLRYPRHDVVSEVPFGGCPASLMPVPLSPAAIEHLGEQFERYRRIRRDRQADQPPPAAEDRPPSPTSPPPYMFRGTTGGDPRSGGQNVDRSGHLRPEDLDPRLLPGQPGRPLGRSQNYAATGDGRLIHTLCGTMHGLNDPCPAQPPAPTTPEPRLALVPPHTAPERNTMSDSRMTEARAMNDAGIGKTNEVAGLIRLAREGCDEAYGLYSLSHDGSQQDAARQAMEHIGAAKEKMNEVLTSLGAAEEAAGNVIF